MNNNELPEIGHAKPILFRGLSPMGKESFGSKDSPRCMLRIPEKVGTDVLQVPRVILPAIPKAASAACSPLPLSPRTGNKNNGFPDVAPRDRGLKEITEINAKAVRAMKKHSSDKVVRIQINEDAREFNKLNSRNQSRKELADQGIYIFED